MSLSLTNLGLLQTCKNCWLIFTNNINSKAMDRLQHKFPDMSLLSRIERWTSWKLSPNNKLQKMYSLLSRSLFFQSTLSQPIKPIVKLSLEWKAWNLILINMKNIDDNGVVHRSFFHASCFLWAGPTNDIIPSQATLSIIYTVKSHGIKSLFCLLNT